MRIAFMGTPDFSTPALQKLIDSDHDVVAVYTQPPRPSGRGQSVTESPVHLLAESHGIEVRYPQSFKKQADMDMFKALNLDLAIVAAYGLILPQDVLDAPKFGCLNIHASLLPRWRGASPIQRAIMANDAQTGICLMQMEAGLDTGPVMMRHTLPITSDTTAQALHDDLAVAGGDMLEPALMMIEAGIAEFEIQPEEGVTYAHKLKKPEGLIEFSEAADLLERKIRALNPWPGTWCEIGPEKVRLKILESIFIDDIRAPVGQLMDRDFTIACGQGGLRLLKVQPASRPAMHARDFLNGTSFRTGMLIQTGKMA